MSIAEALGSDAERIAVHPYQRILLREESEKVDKLQIRLEKKLDHLLHIWIHDSTQLDQELAPREPFLLKIKPTTPVGDIRDQIEEKYNEFGLHDRTIDGPLRLVFNGRTLMDGKRLCDYKLDSKREKWSKPYVGIIWVVPFHIEAQESCQWGSSEAD